MHANGTEKKEAEKRSLETDGTPEKKRAEEKEIGARQEAGGRDLSSFTTSSLSVGH